MPPQWGLTPQHAGIVTKISAPEKSGQALRAFKNYPKADTIIPDKIIHSTSK